MLSPGEILPLTIERPAAGGRMIARADGQIVLVGGAIPGERVTVRVERVRKGVAYAETISLDDPSPDRRAVVGDPLCGGCVYAHIAYPRQLALKALVVADAFARIARLELPAAVPVAASPEEGYRMRARLHARGGRLGFFREGTHDLCAVRQTRQLLPETCDVVERMSETLHALGLDSVREIELSENVEASERVAHVNGAPDADARTLQMLTSVEGLTEGPYVTDIVRCGEQPPIKLRRHVLAFFQGNRYLLRDLVAHVVEQVPRGGTAIDLYAGTGLFSVAAAVMRSARVIAVEGDRVAAADLEVNIAAAGASVSAVHRSVEAFLGNLAEKARSGRAGPVLGEREAGRRDDACPDVVILDPPRTGVTREALDGVIGLGAAVVVYVSCDIATLARDARRLLDAGYTLGRIDAFDLFPNTPHVETVMVFRLV